MKNLFHNSKFNKNNFTGFDSLNDKEMSLVRGGTEPIRPKSQPRDIYDDELE